MPALHLHAKRSSFVYSVCASRAQREEFLMKHQATDAKSVPALHKRLIQRREILSALTHWASSVTKKRWVRLVHLQANTEGCGI